MAASLATRGRAVAASAPYELALSERTLCSTPALFNLGHRTHTFRRSKGIPCGDQGRIRPQRHVPRLAETKFTGRRLSAAISNDEASHKQRFVAIRADGGESATAGAEKSKSAKWDGLTTQLAASSTAAFLVLMLPQILKNLTNLRQGNLAPIGVLPWMGYSTGLLGNTLLLSYFAAKKESGATIVQGVGMLSTYVLLSTIFFGGFMPSIAYMVVSGVVVLGLCLNLLNFGGLLPAAIFNVWQDIAGIVGLSVLPQVVYSTFAPTPSVLPGSLAAAAGVLFIILLRLGKLPESARGFWTQLSAWTATLLFMFMPVSQLVSNFTNPESVKGLSLATVLLGMAGNGLMIPRALFIRDRIWFTGSTWGCMMQGWACLLSMFMYDATDKLTFYGVSGFLFTYFATILLMDGQANGLSNPLSSLVEVVRGRKS
ncbi:hypothetical protein KFL_002230180 [Klebsormidium nitens]|uniref:Uncharacterized protein n=1 Tax=Klebsormidium nitens TaxID=105231 RepID=A0A1Y1I916_KLENI|nr:hypothetical protein KFL_002230180 [Klebsormidium nitens]|eukprot:GAQ85197.1 hypothetical protein KFL_002230180 [Klebsormidium nitens]